MSSTERALTNSRNSRNALRKRYVAIQKSLPNFFWILRGDQLTYYSVLFTLNSRPPILRSLLYTGRLQTILHNSFRSTISMYTIIKQIQINANENSLVFFKGQTVSIMAGSPLENSCDSSVSFILSCFWVGWLTVQCCTEA